MIRSAPADPTSPLPRPLSAWLAGRIDWPGYASLAARLAEEAAPVGGRNPTLVVFELEPAITIGRLGSRADVGVGDDELRSRQLAVRYTGRGGGAVVHGPGQVCVALFASLRDLGLRGLAAGACLERFQTGLAAALRTLRVGPILHPGAHGVFGRTGLLAAIGLAVRNGTLAHGAFVNIGPALELHHRVASLRLPGPAGRDAAVTMGSVEADIQRRVRLQDARSALVEALADAFGFDETLIHAGFPVAASATGASHPRIASRAG